MIFRDKEGSVVSNECPIDVKIVHTKHLAIIEPTVLREENKVGLNWTPTVRGLYEIILNDVTLQDGYDIAVFSTNISTKNCSLEEPKQKTICYSEETEVTFTLKDGHGNTYTQVEEDRVGHPRIQILAIAEKEE